MSTERQVSGRDTKKAQGQIEAPGGAPAPARPTTQSPELAPANAGKSFNLVVCGTCDKADGWLFGSFMGFCMALKNRGIEGDFLTCFPMLERLCWLKNENKPGIDDIKFVQYGSKGEGLLYDYTRVAYCNNQHWWTQVPMENS